MRSWVAVVLAGVALAGCGATSSPGGTGAGSLPLDTRSPLQRPAATMRVLVQFHRPSLADAMKGGGFAPGRQRAYVSSLHDEATATESSLRAKGIRLVRPELYGRVWNGFSATIRARDLPRLQALGLRAEPVRRFFGAAAGAVSAAAKRQGRGSRGEPAVALLDSARHADTLAALLTRGGAGPPLRVRVGRQRRDPESGGRVDYATTDELLAGLERAADPNRDGAVTDHVPVALVGVNSPYAGFDDSPEAEAVAGITSIGTLVVAPAGNEGPSAGRLGTVGSPGAAPDALAVAALEGGGAPALPSVDLGLATSEGRMKASGALLGGRARRPLRAQVAALTGPSQATPKARGRALGDAPLEYFTVDAQPRARARVVVVPARAGGRSPALATRAAAASEGGAAALIVCEPDPKRPLPALPGGVASIPVIGLRGDAGRRALDLTPHDGGLVFISAPRAATDRAPLAAARSSSRGPTYALAPKPDLSASGTGTVGGAFVAGTSLAAARVAGVAAALRRAKPTEGPAEIAARLVQTATPRGPLLAAGAGEPDPARAGEVSVIADPPLVVFPRQAAGAQFTATARATVRNTGTSSASVEPAVSIRGVSATVAPTSLSLKPGRSASVTVTLTGSRPAGYLTGALGLGAAKVPLALPIGPPPPAILSPLRIEGSRGVRFTAGAVSAHGDALSVMPLGDLTLSILDAKGSVVRELTPQGGARDLLPGEYAYTLTKDASSALAPGGYRFRASAHGTAGGPPVVRTSPPFTKR